MDTMLIFWKKKNYYYLRDRREFEIITIIYLEDVGVSNPGCMNRNLTSYMLDIGLMKEKINIWNNISHLRVTTF